MTSFSPTLRRSAGVSLSLNIAPAIVMYALSRSVTSVTNELLQSVRGPVAVTGARDRG